MQVMFSRGRGGLERVFIDHARLLSQRGNIVHCVILELAACTLELNQLVAQSKGNIVLHICPTKNWRRLMLLSTLRRLIARNKPQAIISHGAKVTSRFWLLRPPTTPLFAVTHNYSQRLMKATHLIALTEHAQKLYTSHGFPAERIYKISNPLPTAAAGLQQRQCAEIDGALKIGTLSRLVEKKGIDIFLRGFRIALDRGLNAHAVIGGDGPEQSTLRQLCDSLNLNSDVSFCGWVNDCGDFCAKIDWLCIPSRDEPFGLVALEGFANGTPVLASDVGGLSEIVCNGINGVLFRANDPNELADALLKTYRERPRLAAMCKAAYASLQQYQPEYIAERIESALMAGIAALNNAYPAEILSIKPVT